MRNLLPLDNFYPVIYRTDEFKRKRKRRIVVYGFGHSLRSANQLPAQGVKSEEVSSFDETALASEYYASRNIFAFVLCTLTKAR